MRRYGGEGRGRAKRGAQAGAGSLPDGERLVHARGRRTKRDGEMGGVQAKVVVA